MIETLSGCGHVKEKKVPTNMMSYRCPNLSVRAYKYALISGEKPTTGSIQIGTRVLEVMGVEDMGNFLVLCADFAQKQMLNLSGSMHLDITVQVTLQDGE